MTKRARLLAVAVALFALGVVAAPAAADDPVLTYVCDPPVPRTTASCDQWHTSPVRLFWRYDVATHEPAPLQGSNCASPQLFDRDTAGTRVMCAVWLLSDPTLPTTTNLPTNAIATIRVDQTPPTVTTLIPDRPPDHDGWWNHPVALQFGGSDATSGIARCDLVTYSGPDGGSKPVTGACTDVAGNSATGTLAVKYDATPPVLGTLPPTPSVGHNTVNWTTSADAVATSIVRSPGIGKAAVTEVYSGPDHTFTDSGVTGGKTYTYTLSASDAADNHATTTIDVTAKPTPEAVLAKKLQRRPPRLRWRQIRGADYYNVQLFHGDRKILSVWPHKNGFQLRRTWTYLGHKRLLAAGSYHWYVWPGYGRRSNHRYGKLLAHRRFKMALAK